MRALTLLACLVLALHLNAAAGDFDYMDKELSMQGYLAGGDLPGKRPAVLIVHSWMGLGENEKGRARQLAELGYVAFAADIYGKGVRATNGKEAGELANKYKGDRVLYRRRLKAAMQALSKLSNVNKSKIGAMGYCFGGTGALEAARMGLDLKGAVSFHGGLGTDKPAKVGGIRGAVLVLHGAEDPWVSAEEIKGFEDEMDKVGADWQLVKYSGAVHAFTMKETGNDKKSGAAYDERADKRSWEAMLAFFKETLR